MVLATDSGNFIKLPTLLTCYHGNHFFAIVLTYNEQKSIATVPCLTYNEHISTVLCYYAICLIHLVQFLMLLHHDPSWSPFSMSFCCYSLHSPLGSLFPGNSVVTHHVALLVPSPCHSVVTHHLPLLVPSLLVILLLLTTFSSWFPLYLSFCCYSPRCPLGSLFPCHSVVTHHLPLLVPSLLVILLLLTTFPSWFPLLLSFCCYSPRSPLGSLSTCHSFVTHHVLLLFPSFLAILLLLTMLPSWFPF